VTLSTYRVTHQEKPLKSLKENEIDDPLPEWEPPAAQHLSDAYRDPEIRDLLQYEKWHDPVERAFVRHGQKPEINVAVDTRERSELLGDRLLGDEDFSVALGVRNQMSRQLARIGEETLAEKVGECFETGRVELYELGDTQFVPHSACGYGKLCPFHARTETRRRLRRYLPAVEEAAKKYRGYRHMTLTIPNARAGRLQEDGWDKLWSAWNALRRRQSMDLMVGAIVNWEDTWNPETETHNAHLHALVAIDYGDFDYGLIQSDWQDLTGGKMVRFTEINPRSMGDNKVRDALAEVMKYPTKFTKKSRRQEDAAACRQGEGLVTFPEDAFREWFDVVHGARTMRTYGIFYSIEEPEEEEEERGDMVALLVWRGTRVSLIQVYNSALLEEGLKDKRWITPHQSRLDHGMSDP